MHERRKADHLRISLEKNVRFPHLTTGLEKYRFTHQALPQLDLDRIDCSTELLGRDLQLPLLVSSMTGGTSDAKAINRHLAQAAQERGIALGLGSLRAAIEQPSLRDSFQARDVAPDILLMANLGAVQLNHGYTVEHCQRAIELVSADALILHLNPLQEALQPGGDRDWSGLLEKIELVCRTLSVPVVVKEVGWGISGSVARQLVQAGVAAIDVAGAGGTSWSEVERHRMVGSAESSLASAFSDWGIPTTDSLVDVKSVAPLTPLIASGGIRTGIDVAKVLALGAVAAGIAAPFLRAAAKSTQALLDLIDQIAEELRVAMFCAGAGDVAALSEPGRLVRVT